MSIPGIQVNGSFISCERFLRAIETKERISPGIMRLCEAWIQVNGSFISLQRFLVMGMVIELIALIQPLFFAFLNRGHVQRGNKSRNVRVALTALLRHGFKDSLLNRYGQVGVELGRGSRLCQLML